MSRSANKQLRETLAKNSACYVLITCSQPSADGNMEVELTYEGDASLASYLIQGAQTIIDNDDSFEVNGSSHSEKIYYIE